MLLTATTVGTADLPASDLGFLLHKHPDRAQAFSVTYGTAHVFYPEATAERCTAALLLEIDPVGLVRGRRGPASLSQYVNDRPYAATSLLAGAINAVFRTAMNGRCDARPELVQTPLPLEITIPALPCRGRADLVTRLFEPLGWTVDAAPIPLDERFPDWGASRYVNLTQTGTFRLADALNHLYVLIPVLDGAKHYWISRDEIDKMLRAGEGWLAAHPEQALITRRYLHNQGGFIRTATARLAEIDEEDTEGDEDETSAAPCAEPDATRDEPVPLSEQRVDAVLDALRSAGVRRVADLGCGEGVLLRALDGEPGFTEILGADVSPRALEIASRRLQLDRNERSRITLIQSSLTYRDARLAGYDAAVLMEVVEHVDPSRLPALEDAVFSAARPATVVVTTPNAEYNVRFEWLEPGAFRHRDHRFEWTRDQFAEWTHDIATRHGYTVRILPVGEPDPDVGPPTQLAVFTASEAREVRDAAA